MVSAGIDELERFCRRHRKLLVLTGAGCSTASGIPDYRDRRGAWKHPRPMQYGDFIADPAARRRYWARSLVGWSRIEASRPNAAHRTLAALQRAGRISQLVTQNVDGLHQAAGSETVIDLHGRLDRVRCLGCGATISRPGFQRELQAANPGWGGRGTSAPDGDALLKPGEEAGFTVPDCSACGGTLKPDVVFFGENVPAVRVRTAMTALADADALLVIGSSLMVFSGFRFVREASRLGRPVAAINQGVTRADALLACKLETDCCVALPALLERLSPRPVES